MPGGREPGVLQYPLLSLYQFQNGQPMVLGRKDLFAVDRLDDRTISNAPMSENLPGHEPLPGGEEFDQRIDQAPEKIEYVNGIFASDRERLNVLGMLLENLGIDKVIRFGKLEDWKAAIENLEKKQGAGNQP